MKSSSEYQVPVGIPESDCSMKQEKGVGDVISHAQRLENLQSDHLMVSEILKACERLKKQVYEENNILLFKSMNCQSDTTLGYTLYKNYLGWIPDVHGFYTMKL